MNVIAGSFIRITLKEPLARYTFFQERTLGIFGRCCPEDGQRHNTNFLNDNAVNKSSLQAYGSKALQSVINVGCSETRCWRMISSTSILRQWMTLQALFRVLV